jgi:Fe2+ transport system protein FeoA
MIERRLCDVAPGERVQLVDFDATIDSSLRDRLIAYGVRASQPLDVVQQRPLTIVVCDHAELALEAAVARAIRVRTPPAALREVNAIRRSRASIG